MSLTPKDFIAYVQERLAWLQREVERLIEENERLWEENRRLREEVTLYRLFKRFNPLRRKGCRNYRPRYFNRLWLFWRGCPAS